jgi:transposase
MLKIFGVNFKSKVAIEAIKNDKTIAELSNKYEIHRDLVQKWKKTVVEGSAKLFSATKSRGSKNNEKVVDELYRQIGKLKVENDWLKKSYEISN